MEIDELTVALCSIARRFSRSNGISMRQAIEESGYRPNESLISELDLRRYLTEHPDLVRDWSLYSESKRTGSGWYFNQNHRHVGLFSGGHRDQIRDFNDLASACAYFIKNEVESILDATY